jgi:hypothetical protein
MPGLGAKRARCAMMAVAMLLVAGRARADENGSACTLGSHPGIDVREAETSADVVCHELARRNDLTPRQLRLGRLGGRILMSLSSPSDPGADRHIFVNGLDEVPTAAPRLAEAVVARRSVEDTQEVDNVLGSESSSPKVKAGQLGIKAGLVGALPVVGAATSAAPGAAVSLLYRARRMGVDTHARGGIGTGSTTVLKHFAAGVGAHYYFGDGDIAPFAGAGLALLVYKLEHDRDALSVSSTGLGTYAEVGVEALRTHRVAFTGSLRADIPMFELKPGEGARYERPENRPSSQYIVPISLMVGVLLH